jgi:flavodoxin
MMAKAIVVFESRWGNTQQVAEKIAEGMKQVKGVEAVVKEVKDLDPGQLTGYDLILIGSPNHIGAATRNIGNLVNKLGGLELKGKKVAVFDTYMGGDYAKVTQKLEKMISQKAAEINLISPGLSIKVTGFKGPVAEGELAKCTDFGKKLAGGLKK